MDGQQARILRQRVERELRGILHDEYGLNVDADTPVRYYLDYKTNSRLLELRDVLERMDKGTFGICILCGGSIQDSRLADSPVARLCDSCASAPYAVVIGSSRARHRSVKATPERG